MAETKKSGLVKYAVTGTVVIILIAFGIYYFVNKDKYQTTDNAQIDGDIVSIRSSVTAYVDQINFDDNQQVKAGDTLVKFNTTLLQAGIMQARAALAGAQASIKVNSGKATASAENAAASFLTAQANQQTINIARAQLKQAQEEYNRMQRLMEVKGATQQQLEAAQTSLTVAKAQYEDAVNKQQSSLTTAKGQGAVAKSDKAQIQSAEALVEQRKAELLIAEDNMKHAYVIAPRSGTVTKRAVQTGQYVSAGSSLCSIVDEQHLWVTANVKETQLSSIKIGQTVEIEIDAYPGTNFTGKVASYGGATGAKFSLIPPDNASGNFVKVVQRFPIRILLHAKSKDDKDKAPLFPGLSASVKIRTK